MVRLGIILLLLFAACHQAAAKAKPFIEIITEANTAFLGDTIVIEVRWSGLLDPIDFGPLLVNAELVRETVGTRIAVADGEVIDISSRRMELLPRQIGSVTLGPLRSGDVVSNSVTVDVTPMSSVVWRPGPDDIRLEQTISTTSPWIQQQVTLDIVLVARYPVAGEKITLPNLETFRAVTIFSERRTADAGNDGLSRWAWRYLLFPQKSGKLSVPGMRISGTIAKSRTQRASFDLTASSTDLDVKPSAFSQSNWWVAATSLDLSDAWSGDVKAMSAGDEIERNIIVDAKGILPEQIPEIAMPETNGLAITSLGTTRNGGISNDISNARATFRFRVRALSPVPVFLDTVRLRWWNTSANRSEEAIIPARRIDIGVPDRSKLLNHAAGNMNWVDRLRATLEGYASAIWIVAFVTMAAAASAVALWGQLGDAIRTIGYRRSIRNAARSGDVNMLYRALHAAANSPWANTNIATALSKLETHMFGRATGCPNLARLAADALAAKPSCRKISALDRLPEI